MYSWGAWPFALDVKGGEWLGVVVAIKSKGGDCWHYDTGVVPDGNSFRWKIIVQEVNNKELQMSLQRMKKERYTQVHWTQVVYTYTHTFIEGKVHISWKTKFLVHDIWSMVFWSMVLVQGIWSEVLTLGIWSKLLFLSIVGLWYWERPKSIQGG